MFLILGVFLIFYATAQTPRKASRAPENYHYD